VAVNLIRIPTQVKITPHSSPFPPRITTRQELDADDEAKELNKDMKEKRDALKKILLERASLCGIVADKDYAEVSQFEKAVKDLKQWNSVRSNSPSHSRGMHVFDKLEKMALAILFC